MKLKVVDVIQNRKSKKGFAIRLLVSSGFGEVDEVELINVFSWSELTIKKDDLIDLVPASDSNFFPSKVDNTISSSIKSLIK